MIALYYKILRPYRNHRLAVFLCLNAENQGLSLDVSALLTPKTWRFDSFVFCPKILDACGRDQMGGLQEATRWRGPMLTDSGGYQIFSMGHGSVGAEIKGRRGAEGGAHFRESNLLVFRSGSNG